MTGLGGRVRALRLARGWSQRQLAHVAGLSLATVVNVEAERHGAQLHTVVVLADVLDTTVAVLAGEQPMPAPPRAVPYVPWDLVGAEIAVIRARFGGAA